MNPHDTFEERLRRQPIRPAPEQWRTDILAAARSAETVDPTLVRKNGGLESYLKLAAMVGLLRRFGSELFCPGRKAWSTLAAAWAIIIFLTLANRDNETAAVASSKTISPVAQQLLKEQARLLAEFSSGGDAADARDAVEPRRPDARPRSEKQPRWTNV